jgi:hypothetical protein
LAQFILLSVAAGLDTSVLATAVVPAEEQVESLLVARLPVDLVT